MLGRDAHGQGSSRQTAGGWLANTPNLLNSHPQVAPAVSVLELLEINIIAQRRRGCSLSRVRVNGVKIYLRPGGRTGIVIL